MTGFKYTYLSINEIFEKLNYISNNYLMGIFLLTLTIIIIISLNNYIFPSILFIIENYKKELNKKKRKILLKQIQLQREVEDEIEKSLK